MFLYLLFFCINTFPFYFKNEELTSILKSHAIEALKLFHTPENIENTLINAEYPGLNCPYCIKVLTPQYRTLKTGDLSWDINNYRRHLRKLHAKEKSNVLFPHICNHKESIISFPRQ